MKTIKLLIAMTLIGSLYGCKTPHSTGSENNATATTEQTPAMPEGQLTEVAYRFQGMHMEPVAEPVLYLKDGQAMLKFNHFGQEYDCEVSDTLFSAARTIIDEERIYAYAPHYSLDPAFESRMLDGYSWSFSATFLRPDGTKERIHSGGRHVSPDGNGLNRISKLLIEAALTCIKELGQ